MMFKYYISGDKTGITYGVYKLKPNAKSPFDTELVKGGFKTITEAQKEIRKLEKEEKR